MCLSYFPTPVILSGDTRIGIFIVFLRTGGELVGPGLENENGAFITCC